VVLLDQSTEIGRPCGWWILKAAAWFDNKKGTGRGPYIGQGVCGISGKDFSIDSISNSRALCVGYDLGEILLG
jgi:hypothetical protein